MAVEEAWVKLAWFETDFSESITAMVEPQVGSLDQFLERLL
jgi:gamma-glutamylcysteine synthetase